MKIGFITTLHTNIGDDFIRTGIEQVIQANRKGKPVSYTYVNKHLPHTALKGSSLLQWLEKLPRFRGKGRLIDIYHKWLVNYANVFRNQDLIIQSGAPVLWPDCHLNEWAQPIWYDIIGKLYRRIPVLNLAAGACYPWERQDGFTNAGEMQYARDIGGFCALTVTRDQLAHRLFGKAGITNSLLPCSAFHVNDSHQNQETGNYILINYMHGAGHYDWGQHINPDQWLATITAFIKKMEPDHEIRFICHNENEYKLAIAHFPGHHVHFPGSIKEYMECIRFARAGLCNRMHAAVALASMGIPSISVCTDTRLLMLNELNQPNFYVKDVDSFKLAETMQQLLLHSENEKKRLFELKQHSFRQYRKLLEPYV